MLKSPSSSADKLNSSSAKKDVLDNQLGEETVTFSDKESKDSVSLESDSSSNSSENEELEKYHIMCHLCDKKFANKRSLASHKSRFHRGLHGDNINSASSNEGMNKTLSSQSEEESKASSDKESTADSTSSASENGNMDNSDESYSNHSTDHDSNISTTSTRRKAGLKRKERVNLAKFNATLTKILDSMKNVLQCKNKEDEGCFDLLFSYELKNKVFVELESIIRHRHGLDIDMILSTDELSLVKAVLSTESLTEIKELLNENTEILMSIMKQHFNFPTKRRKHDE